MAEPATRTDMTLEGFLAWEERQTERHERVRGVVRMMSGGTRAHTRIAGNIIATLLAALRGGPCEPLGSDMKLVSSSGDVFYPDVLVRCGPLDDRAKLVDDPIVVFEVLSESTAVYDLSRKRLAYKAMPSLRAIVYVAQDAAWIDVVRRGADGRWEDGPALSSLAASLSLPEIGVELRVADIYEGTEIARGGEASAQLRS